MGNNNCCFTVCEEIGGFLKLTVFTILFRRKLSPKPFTFHPLELPHGNAFKAT